MTSLKRSALIGCQVLKSVIVQVSQRAPTESYHGNYYDNLLQEPEKPLKGSRSFFKDLLNAFKDLWCFSRTI